MVDDSHARKVRIVVIHLVQGISPAIAYSDTCQMNAMSFDEGFVFQNLSCQTGNIVTSKRLPGDIERRLFQSRPGLVKVIHEVDEMVGGLISTRYLVISFSISVVGKADVQGRVDEDHACLVVPSVFPGFDCVVDDLNWTNFGEGSELGTCSRSSLKPNHQRYSFVFYLNVVTESSKESIEHVGRAFGVVPVDLFVA